MTINGAVRQYGRLSWRRLGYLSRFKRQYLENGR